jgi:hypothetical protein
LFLFFFWRLNPVRIVLWLPSSVTLRLGMVLKASLMPSADKPNNFSDLTDIPLMTD